MLPIFSPFFKLSTGGEGRGKNAGDPAGGTLGLAPAPGNPIHVVFSRLQCTCSIAMHSSRACIRAPFCARARTLFCVARAQTHIRRDANSSWSCRHVPTGPGGAPGTGCGTGGAGGGGAVRALSGGRARCGGLGRSPCRARARCACQNLPLFEGGEEARAAHSLCAGCGALVGYMCSRPRRGAGGGPPAPGSEAASSAAGRDFFRCVCLASFVC